MCVPCQRCRAGRQSVLSVEGALEVTSATPLLDLHPSTGPMLTVSGGLWMQDAQFLTQNCCVQV